MLSFILLCMSCLVFIPSIYVLCRTTTFKGRYLLIATLLLQTIICCWSDITTSYYREIDKPSLICDLLCIYLLTIPVVVYFIYTNRMTHILNMYYLCVILIAILFWINSAVLKLAFPVLSKQHTMYTLVNMNHVLWHMLVGYLMFSIVT